MVKQVTGYCPYIKEDLTISVNYTYVPILGSLKDNYKRGSFTCPYYDECPVENMNERGECSLFLECPLEIQL